MSGRWEHGEPWDCPEEHGDEVSPSEWAFWALFVAAMVLGGVYGLLAGVGVVSAASWSPLGG